MKKIILMLVLMLMTVFVLTACGDKETSGDDVTPTEAPDTSDEGDEDETPEATSTPTPTPLPRDLGEIDIIMGDWWSTEEIAEPKNQKEEDTNAYREEIQKTHNFTFKSVNIAGWNDYQELFTTSTMSGNPAADIFSMDQKFVPEPLKMGLFYPVSELPSFDFNDSIWNHSMRDYMTQDGVVYGFTEEQNGPGLGVFFNKRLFEEAGFEGDYLYDLQKNGEWTWDTLEEVCGKLVKDTNADGITDVYPICCWQVEMVKAGVFSNNSDYVRYNPDTERYENNQMADNYLDSVKLAVDYYHKGYIMPDPEDAEWTWFEGAFTSGQAAMLVTEWYRNSALQEMEDDWGYVFFPAGPDGEMKTMYTRNPKVMPTDMDPQRADDVAFAYSKWIAPPPGYEDVTDDMTDYYSSTRDARAVDETIAAMIDGQGVMSLLYQIPGLSFKYGSNMDGGGLSELSAIEIAEEASAQFDALINDFYAE